MKKNTMLFLVFGMVLAQMGYSHPPSKIELSYDAGSFQLEVIITHPSKDAARHFINKIAVEVNQEQRIEQNLVFQKDSEKVRVLFTLFDVKPGDEIQVTAFCNVFGNLKKTLKI